MATVAPPLPSHLLVGETVHYRDHDRCWAAAVVENGPHDTVQVYLFPLPPSHPMPQAPGTFIGHDAAGSDETWHRLTECRDARPPDQDNGKRRRGGRRSRG